MLKKRGHLIALFGAHLFAVSSTLVHKLWKTVDEEFVAAVSIIGCDEEAAGEAVRVLQAEMIRNKMSLVETYKNVKLGEKPLVSNVLACATMYGFYDVWGEVGE